jgi:mono/diheme cytochrome c family protein
MIGRWQWSATALLLVFGARNVLAAPNDQAGANLFAQKCGICHGEGKTGAQMLARRLGAERALLAERADLVAPYVRTVVRHGLAGMPPLTRVELPDTELDAIAAYLTRPRPASAADRTDE